MVAFTLFTILAGAQAQPEPTVEKKAADEIVVTGERVPRSLKQTASSVVVISGREIEAQAADRVDQLLAQIPNVQLGSGTEAPAIRGQDSTGVVRELFAFLGGTRPRATMTIDGRAITFSEYVNGAASAWDVERVEVFRSPQTTTQGRNSIAGAIFVNTRDPTYQREVRARAIVGNLGTRQMSAVVSGPIVDDQLAIRLSGDLKRGRNSSDMADGIEGANIDRDDHGFVRVKLLAEPRAFPGLRVEASYVHSETQAPQFEAIRAPFKQRRSPLLEQTNGVIRTNVDSVTGVIDYALSPALRSQTTLSYGKALIQRFGLPGLGRTRNDSTDSSLESILQWKPQGSVQLVGGIHYLTLRQRQSIDVTGLRIGTGGFRDRQHSFGLFGELTWRPVARLALTGGFRHQRDSQERVGQVGPVGPGITVDYDEAFQAWLPKLSIAYDLGKDATLGFLIQRAYSPGGTTVNLATRKQDDFDAERLWNYEAFLRVGFAQGRGSLAVNLFNNDIEDAQRPQTIEFLAPDGIPFTAVQIDNAPSARSRGLEVELGWRASDRLSLRLGLGLLDTKVRRTLVASDAIRGKEFQRSPNFSAAAAIDWRPVDSLQLSAQLRTGGDYFSDDANTPNRRIGGYTTLNARAAYTIGPVTAFGYVRNLFDNFYLTHLFGPTFGTAGDPREFGLGLETRF
ncbi:MAG: TonB-dependent receptor [Pseudomonadota bacterium]